MHLLREVVILLAVGVLAKCQIQSNNNNTTTKGQTDEYQYDEYEEREQVLFSEEKPCPRDCICTISRGYRIANCNRLELGTQQFGDDITDLVLENIGDSHPIILDDMIFKKLGLHQIATVKIVNSTIISISPAAFHGLHELYAVNLSGNKIKKIHPETFAHNKKLMLLSLSNNPLEMPLDGYFLNSSTVQELDISKCEINQLNPKTFLEMTRLVYVNLASNYISEINEDLFKYLQELSELDLSDNTIRALPSGVFENNGELATLHIQRNPIESVYGVKAPELLTLNAGEAKIKFVGPSMFNEMPYVANLNLSGNGVRKIHNQAFHKLIELNFLDLSNNNLDFISGVLIKENIELDIFKIANNPTLKRLPENGFECGSEEFNIYLFDASGCALEEISDNALITFTSLTQLYLSNNKLSHIGDKVFSHSIQLIEIDLSNNLLKSLDKKMFAQNKDLTKLVLRGNPLKFLSSDVFIYTPKLNILDVSNTQLTTLWQESEPHPAVLLNNLKSLNISNNNIKELKITELKMIEKLRTLDIANNPLDCSKEFELLMTWLNDHKVLPWADETKLSNMETELTEKTIDPSYSWDFLARKTCKDEMIDGKNVTQISQLPSLVETEIWDEVVKQVNNKDIPINLKDNSKYTTLNDNETNYDYDDELFNLIGDDGDEDDNDAGDGENLDQDLDISVKVIERKQMADEIENEAQEIFGFKIEKAHNPYNYLWSILIVVLSVLLLLIVIGKIVMTICQKQNRRHMYNSAIIAAMSHNQNRTKKDCGLVYQQLSEDLSGPKTPILNRFAPVHNPTLKTTNVSYQSSQFHHSNIIPEAV